MKVLIRGVVFASMACFASAAFAHHSFAMFDFSKDLPLKGVITEFRWANPHIHIHLNVTDAKGVVNEWDIEGGTPDSLRRQGWSRDAVKYADAVSLVVHPLKNGGLGGSLVRAYYADGALVGARSATAPSTAPAR